MYGESVVQEIITDNKTINILVESPTNEITVHVDNDEIERLVTTIENMHDKDQGYDNGDVLMSSATILSFLGFGSFLVIRGNYADKANLIWKKTTVVLASVLIIVILHLSTMSQILSGHFSPTNYITIIGFTGVIISIITLTMISINLTLSKLQKIPATLVDITSELEENIQSRQKIEKKQKKIDDTLDEFTSKIKDIKNSD